ncbi:hypothetical protein HZ326_0799 [Fusarium oxysporum f. sp. albedinis]|nr:hypothetical protein HZ326_0799 [Fusarium oxysporum f. sp. albedinis]
MTANLAFLRAHPVQMIGCSRHEAKEAVICGMTLGHLRVDIYILTCPNKLITVVSHLIFTSVVRKYKVRLCIGRRCEGYFQANEGLAVPEQCYDFIHSSESWRSKTSRVHGKLKKREYPPTMNTYACQSG